MCFYTCLSQYLCTACQVVAQTLNSMMTPESPRFCQTERLLILDLCLCGRTHQASPRTPWVLPSAVQPQVYARKRERARTASVCQPDYGRTGEKYRWSRLGRAQPPSRSGRWNIWKYFGGAHELRGARDAGVSVRFVQEYKTSLRDHRRYCCKCPDTHGCLRAFTSIKRCVSYADLCMIDRTKSSQTTARRSQVAPRKYTLKSASQVSTRSCTLLLR